MNHDYRGHSNVQYHNAMASTVGKMSSNLAGLFSYYLCMLRFHTLLVNTFKEPGKNSYVGTTIRDHSDGFDFIEGIRTSSEPLCSAVTSQHIKGRVHSHMVVILDPKSALKTNHLLLIIAL